MTTDELDGRWPFPTNGAPHTTHSFNPGNEQAVAALVTPAAEVLGTDPRTLPPLYDRVNPNSIDRLLDVFPSGPPDGVRIAIESSWDSASVLVRDDGHVATYPSDRTPNRLDPVVELEHEWSGTSSLVWSIGRAIASAATDDATADDATGDTATDEIAETLLEHVDADALDQVLHPRPADERTDSRLILSIDGYEVSVEPDGSIAVEPSLTVLKRSGSALLVVGSVPEDTFDRAAATLLGTPDEDNTPLFVHHGQDLAAANRRLSMAGHAPSSGTVLDHQSTAARAAAAAPEGDSYADHELDEDTGPAVIPHFSGIDALPGAVRETAADSGLSEHGQLRVGVDSVHSMLASTSLEKTREAIERIGHVVREHRGIGHFLLSAPADDDAVAALAPSFDAVVELRVGDVDVEQQWRLTETGYETAWFPLE